MPAEILYWLGQFQSWQNDLAALAMLVIVGLTLLGQISRGHMVFGLVCVALLFTIVALVRGAPTG